MPLTIKPLDREDKEAWLDLWQGYLEHYGENASAHLTFTTFDRLVTREHPLRARVALNEARKIVGFVHYFLHESTWYTREVCFVEDVFVTPSARRKGVGRELIEDVVRVAGINTWGRLYMSVPGTDTSALAFFGSVADDTDWVVFERKL